MRKWEGIEEFVAVTEAKSFTAAAKRLAVSTAHVSRQINTLEERLGAKLFYRTTRKVTSTEVGKIYYQHCRQVLDSLEEAEHAVTQLQSAPRGLLRLTCSVAYGDRFIAPMVNEFVSLYPELSIQMISTNQVVDLVEEGIDLAIRFGQLEDSSLIARKLAPRTLYVCGSPQYFSRHGQPHTLSELNSQNCLLGTLDYWSFVENNKNQTIKVSGNWRCNSGPALLDAALRGIGLVQLPDYYVVEHLQKGRLISVLDKYRQADSAVWAVYPSNRHLSPKVRLLVDFLRERITQHPAYQHQLNQAD
jgi:DNA-binding transcriptional LysR family regulator